MKIVDHRKKREGLVEVQAITQNHIFETEDGLILQSQGPVQNLEIRAVNLEKGSVYHLYPDTLVTPLIASLHIDDEGME